MSTPAFTFGDTEKVESAKIQKIHAWLTLRTPQRPKGKIFCIRPSGQRVRHFVHVEENSFPHVHHVYFGKCGAPDDGSNEVGNIDLPT